MGTPGPRKVARYGTEFKLKAVGLSLQPGMVVKEVAASLSLPPALLARWRMQLRRNEPFDKEPEAVRELLRLRQVERDFLRLKADYDRLKTRLDAPVSERDAPAAGVVAAPAAPRREARSR